MREPLKPGDRVAAYNEGGRYEGRIEKILNGTLANVRIPRRHLEKSVSYAQFHVKQLRRLKKRERRRVWIDEDNLRALSYCQVGDTFPSLIVRNQPAPGCVEFREVLK